MIGLSDQRELLKLVDQLKKLATSPDSDDKHREFLLKEAHRLQGAAHHNYSSHRYTIGMLLLLSGAFLMFWGGIVKDNNMPLVILASLLIFAGLLMHDH